MLTEPMRGPSDGDDPPASGPELGDRPTQVRRPGEVVELGDDPPAVAFVRRGRVLASIVDQNGDEVVSMLRGEGCVIGLERLRGAVFPYEIWPLTDAELVVVPLSELRAWSEANPRGLADLAVEAAFRCIAERTASHGGAAERVARFLVDATADAHDGSLRLPRHVIARILRMRPETLSRTLHRLADAGLVDLHPRLRVRDRDRLALVCEPGRRQRSHG
jgi:CRP-like cAMP-binding protein